MKPDLANWFKLWNPRYRLLTVQLLLAGTLAACLVYAQNYLLASLTQVLIAESPGSTPSPLFTTTPAREFTALPAFLQNLPSSLDISLPVVLLLLFILAHLFSTSFEFLNIYATGKLRIKSRTDLEAEVLMHLLGKDDDFFNVHSTSETVNRISLDVFRVCERRCIALRFWWAAVLILGNLIFFFQKDLRLALLAMSFCLAAALWTYIMTRGVKHMDQRYLYQDDSVKSRFEDFLRAAPEIQVGSLSGKVRKNFAELQNYRAKTYMRYVKLSGIVTTGNLISALLALVGAILVVMYAKKAGAGGPALALFPVVIMSLPTLFTNASQLVTLNIDFQLAHNSMIRLLEYETRPEKEIPPPVLKQEAASSGEIQPIPALNSKSLPASTIRLEDVTYLYYGLDRSRQGVVDFSASFTPGRWIAIAGPAGCGKSTLVKLLVGRLQPQKGQIYYGDMIVEPFDNRLSSMVSIMPQSLGLLHATIYENLFLGRVDASWGQASLDLPSPADLEIIEAAGVGRLCRLKSLDMTPREPAIYYVMARDLPALRSRAKAFFVQQGMKALTPEGVFMEQINPSLTWRGNLTFGVVQGPIPDATALRFIEEEGLSEIFTREGLEFDIGRRGGNLSGGQGQLVALGRALLRRTPVLVLDEPTSSLDPASKTNVARLLQAWKNDRIVITVSHDPEFVAWADEIILMDSGRITFQGSVSDMGQDSKLFRRVLGKS